VDVGVPRVLIGPACRGQHADELMDELADIRGELTAVLGDALVIDKRRSCRRRHDTRNADPAGMPTLI
jgi:hypothetical protein